MAQCFSCKKEVFRYTVRPSESGDSVTICRQCDKSPIGYMPFKAYWDTNIADKPVYIDSDHKREQVMRENGLQVRPREHIDDLNHRRWTKGLPPLEK